MENVQLQKSSRLSFSWQLSQGISGVPSDSGDGGQQASSDLCGTY